jgi:circadian clock protein KaiB
MNLEKAAARRQAQQYVLRLYIADMTPHSLQPVGNIRNICEEHLQDRYELDVVDIHQQPTLTEGEQIRHG